MKPLCVDLYCGWNPACAMFQSYLITCLPTGKSYVGITSASLRRRWLEHQSNARRRPHGGALYAAILKYGASAFSIEALACGRSWKDLCAIEETLIRQWSTLLGYNLTFGGEGRFGFKPSRESVERSAAKHRGKPCPPNTREAAIRTHRNKPKSQEHRERISAAKRGVPKSSETKVKLAAYWAARRAAGSFKTEKAYAHSRKAASAQIARIPFELSNYIARVFKP